MAAIGFLNDQILYRDADGGLSCNDAFVAFLLAFRRHYDHVVLFSRVHPTPIDAPLALRVEGEGVEVIELPFYPRISALFTHPVRHWPGLDRALERLHGLDAVWLNTGHPVSVRALQLLGPTPRPRLVAALRGDYERDASIREGGAARVARAIQTAMMHAFAHYARRRGVPVLAYGDAAVARAQQLGLRALPFETTLLDGQLIADPPAPDPLLAVDLLVVCRLVREKGLDRLIEALPGLRGRDGRPATLAIVGEGPQEAPLRALVAAHGLDERVAFRGYVAHGKPLMQMVRSATVFALPSRTEGVPATVLEAMAMRVPVVATAVGGLPTLLADGRGVLLDAAEEGLGGRLQAALQQMLDDPAQRERIAAAAFQHVSGLTVEAQIARVVNVLEGADAPDA